MKSISMRAFFSVLLIFGLALTSGCATSGSPDNDPFEKVNRVIHRSNLKADKYLLAPAARGYVKVVPQPVRNGVNNFFSNIWEPVNIVNDLLQGKVRTAGKDTGRFLINTTLGFLGFADVATEMNLPKSREDVGQTLAKWGVPAGPYIVLPFFGPSNLRDTVGIVTQSVYLDPVGQLNSPENIYGAVARAIDGRSRVLGIEELIEQQADSYIFLREGYRQQRRNQIYDGVPPEDELSDDALLDEALEEN